MKYCQKPTILLKNLIGAGCRKATAEAANNFPSEAFYMHKRHFSGFIKKADISFRKRLYLPATMPHGAGFFLPQSVNWKDKAGRSCGQILTLHHNMGLSAQLPEGDGRGGGYVEGVDGM